MKVVIMLKDGKKFTTKDIAEMFGISLRSAQRMMVQISWLLPVVKIDGFWQIVER